MFSAGRAFTRPFAAVLGALLVAAPRMASAQAAAVPNSSQFLPRIDFAFGWSGLVAADNRFNWEGSVRFGFDVVDYGAGRVTFTGEYSAILGRERRRYDLNQGNYLFEVTSSRRFHNVELAGVISHVSRHLVDREHRPAISWNTIGARVRYSEGPIQAQAELTRAMQQAFVDYVWTSRARVAVRHPLSRRTEVVTSADGDLIGINHRVRDRRVCGGRVEGGLRIHGDKAVVELFAGYERRIDAFPTDRFRVRMVHLGFRVLSK